MGITTVAGFFLKYGADHAQKVAQSRQIFVFFCSQKLAQNKAQQLLGWTRNVGQLK